MDTITKGVNKLLPFGKKAKKYLPFFIGFKLLTFTGFLTYIMNRWIISPSSQIAISSKLTIIVLAITFDIGFEP